MINLADEILKKIQEINTIRAEIIKRGEAKANAIGNYDRAMALVIIQLKNGVEFDLHGVKIKEPAATYLKEIAKGLCEVEKIEMEKHEMLYKSVLTNLEATLAQLNAFQSLFRYQQEN